MIDSTVIRAHHPSPGSRVQINQSEAAGAKGGRRDRVLAAREVASRPGSNSASTRQARP